MTSMLLILLFLIGISVGSFLNVLIDRLPRNEQVFKGRSYCDYCKKSLSFYDMVPVVSYIILTGRCRYCQKSISRQYPLIELITGISFVGVYLVTFYSNFFELPITNYQLPIINLVYNLIILSGLVVIFFADLKYRIIPDQVLFLITGVSFLYIWIFKPDFLTNHIITGSAAFLLFLAIYLATRGRGMGFGDVKYSFFMGLFLGFPKTVISFYLAFLTGALVSLILIFGKIKKMKDAVPFGPFLVSATVVSYIWGGSLWRIFLKLVGL